MFLCRILCPLNVLSMAEDIKENEMTSVSSVDYVRGLKGKDSVLIALKELLSEVLMCKGTLAYTDAEGLDNLTTPGTYFHGSKIVGTIGSYGILMVVVAFNYVAQLDVCSNKKILLRFSPDSGSTWGEWASITLT